MTVVTHDEDVATPLTESQQVELEAAAAELDRGEFVTLDKLLEILPSRG